MVAFVLGLALMFAQATTSGGSGACETLMDSVRVSYPAQATDETELQAFLGLVERTKACFGVPLPIHAQSLYSYELTTLNRLKQWQKALARVDTFLQQDVAPPDALLREMYHWRGYLQYNLANFPESVSAYLQSLAYVDSSDVGIRSSLHTSIGSVYQRFRNFDAGDRHFQQAHTLLTATRDTSVAVEKSRAFLGHSWPDLLLEKMSMQGRMDVEVLNRILHLLRKSLDSSRAPSLYEEKAAMLILLGEVETLQNSLDSAQVHFDEALALVDRLRNPRQYSVLMRTLARLYVKTGRPAEAHKAYNIAAQSARWAGYLDHERRAYIGKAYLHESQGDPVEAERWYQATIDVTESYVASLRTTDWAAAAFGQWQDAYRGLVRVLIAQGRTEEAFLVLEGIRARHLRDLYQQSRFLQDLPSAERAQYDSLTALLSDTRNLLADSLQASRHRALRRHEAQLIAERRRLIDLPPLEAALSIADLQDRLREENQVLLSYLISSPGLNEVIFGYAPPSYAFVLTPDALHVVPLYVTDQHLQTLLADISPVFVSNSIMPGMNEMQYSLAASHRVFETVFAPLVPFLPSTERLVVIPDGPLFMLPFGMLVEGTAQDYGFEAAPFLLKKYAFVYEIGASLILRSAPALADPAFDIAALGLSSFEEHMDAHSSPLPPLPGIADELDRIADRFQRVAIRREDEATAQNLFRLSNSARILHIASHALINPTSPLYNVILLSPESGVDDGLLYLHELQHHPISVQLVVLNGCSTARGELLPGEGMAGMQYGFRAMGVPSSLATLWFVEDTASATLTDLFYQGLQAGLDKDIALQKAQLAYLATAPSQYRSPFFWAASVLYGNTDTLALEAPAPRTPVMVLLVSLFVLLVALLGFANRHRLRP